ncbi:MAG: hypothetical protein IJW92_01020 [Clostridia bacterium]|nr:hypothetical protein [Clostridia bacterium]
MTIAGVFAIFGDAFFAGEALTVVVDFAAVADFVLDFVVVDLVDVLVFVAVLDATGVALGAGVGTSVVPFFTGVGTFTLCMDGPFFSVV